MRYAIVIEKAAGNYFAYVPDLPGCVATGQTVAEVEAEIGEAIAFHVEGLREEGLPIPMPSSKVDCIEVATSPRF
jgi:predicted RNase H-like HicB family nuclease